MERLSHRLRQSGLAVCRLLWDFRVTLLVVAVVLGLSLISLLALESGFVTRDQLFASRSNPLGVVISVFSHWDRERLWVNTQGLLFYAGAYIFASIPQASEERVRRGNWFAWFAIPTAVAVNIVYVSFSTVSTLGASGLVYAVFGAALVFLVQNFAGEINDLYLVVRKRKSIAQKSPPPWWRGVDLLLFLTFLYLLVFYRDLVFGVGQSGANPFAHILGFASGFVLTGWKLRSRKAEVNDMLREET